MLNYHIIFVCEHSIKDSNDYQTPAPTFFFFMNRKNVKILKGSRRKLKIWNLIKWFINNWYNLSIIWLSLYFKKAQTVLYCESWHGSRTSMWSMWHLSWPDSVSSLLKYFTGTRVSNHIEGAQLVCLFSSCFRKEGETAIWLAGVDCQ